MLEAVLLMLGLLGLRMFTVVWRSLAGGRLSQEEAYRDTAQRVADAALLRL